MQGQRHFWSDQFWMPLLLPFNGKPALIASCAQRRQHFQCWYISLAEQSQLPLCMLLLWALPILYMDMEETPAQMLRCFLCCFSEAIRVQEVPQCPDHWVLYLIEHLGDHCA